MKGIPETITIKEAAKLIDVNEKTIRRLISRKLFEIRRPTSRIQIVRDSFVDWYNSTASRV